MRRSRDQIVKSLRNPPKPEAPPAQARATLYRKVRISGASARQRVGVSAAQAYRAHLHAFAQPMSIGVAAAIAAGGALAAAGIDLYLIAVAAPLVWLSAYGAASATIGSVARRQSRDEIELAGALDQLVESAARDLPDGTVERLGRLKALLVRLLAGLPELRRQAVLSGDDAFFVRQVVGRYVPDALAPYLALPAARRADAGASGESPERMLNEQLELIEEKLAALVQRADEAQLDRMRRNRSFLERKLR